MSLSPSLSPNGDPPVPLSGTFNTSTRFFSLLFDKPLKPAVLNVLSWTMRYNRIHWTFSSLNASGNYVSGFGAQGPPVPPAQWVTYNPAVPDLEGQNGKLVLPFIQLPLT